ncbi:MAG: hypothetical protein HY796_09425 [Elusimicrobia bacterium]|nr:hypothetical protein [Elusimicrobiota bacterium]
MKKTLYFILTLSIGANLSALELNGINAADIKGLSALDLTAPAAAKAAPGRETGRAYQNVWMYVRNNPSWHEAEANDYGARIEARVRKVFDGQYDVNLRTDTNYAWGAIRKIFDKDFQLSGSGLYLSMNEWGGNYNISGNVTGEDNQNKYINLTLFKRFDETSFSVTSGGIYLSIDKNSINGNYDDRQYSKKAIAAIVSLVLTVQLEQTPAPKTEKAARYDQRIWLTIRPGFGWNTVEASDPFSRIEVGLRKIFDGEYNAELTTDNDRELGRSSHFFTDRYELRAGRTDLRLEEWIGDYRVEGEVAVDGAENGVVRVRLEMRRRFNDFSFYIHETGIYLNIDEYGISGDVDTKVYPKKVVAAITALVMTLQQEKPAHGNPKTAQK